MIIDLHTHTRRHSSCSLMSPEELIAKASRKGLDAVVITEHDYLWTRRELERCIAEAEIAPVLILRGQEVSCSDGHLLVYGLDEAIDLHGSCDRIARLARERGGASVLAHPFRWNNRTKLEDEELAEVFAPFDAIEALTTNHTYREQRRAFEVGEKFGIPVTGGSDAHIGDLVGRYATEFPGRIGNEQELAAALREGGFELVSGAVPFRGQDPS